MESYDVPETWAYFAPYPIPKVFEYDALPDPENYIRLLRFISPKHIERGHSETAAELKRNMDYWFDHWTDDPKTSPLPDRRVLVGRAAKASDRSHVLQFHTRYLPWPVICNKWYQNGDTICRIETWRRDDAPPYIAVSYAWGKENSQGVIQLNGKTFDGNRFGVSENCFRALRTVRGRMLPGVSHCWIDAICINQRDMEEKCHQVGIMGGIYSSADAVFGLLDPGTCWQVQYHLRWILALRNEMKKTRNSTLDACRSYLERRHKDGSLDDLARALVQYTRGRYWTRLWIVQEIMLARRLFIVHDSVMVHEAVLSDLFKAAEPLDIIVERWHQNIADSPMFSVLRHRWARRRLPTAVGSFTPANALLTFQQWRCSNRLDHIYGLLGLIRMPVDCANIIAQPNYQLDNVDLALRMLGCFGTKFERGIGDNLTKALRALCHNLEIYADLPDVAMWIQTRRDLRPRKDPLRLPTWTKYVTYAAGFHDHSVLSMDAEGRPAALYLVDASLGCDPEAPSDNRYNTFEERSWSRAPSKSELGRAKRARAKSLINNSAACKDFCLGASPSKVTGNDMTCYGTAGIPISAGDVLLQLGPFESVYLILRQATGSTYEIIGQALIHQRFDTCRWARTKGNDCTCRSPVRQLRNMAAGPRFVVHFHPLDLLVLAAQDCFEDRDKADMAYYNRAVTRVCGRRFSSYAIRESGNESSVRAVY